jgi:hypothetical protein
MAVLIFGNLKWHTWRKREMHTVLAKNPEGKRLLERYKCRLADNLEINNDRNVMGGCGVDSCG